MGELKVYQPTKGMSSADRTVEGYRAVIKEWIHSLEDVLAPFYTMSDFTNGKGVSLAPTDPNINKVTHQIWIDDSSNIYLWGMTYAEGTGASYSAALNNDPKLYVWIADDGAGFGMTNVPIIMGVINTIDYDGNEQYVAFVNQSSMSNMTGNFLITKSNGTNADGFSTNIEYYSGGTNYCVKPHTCGRYHLINNHIYSFDGGLGRPEYRTMFTINDEKYFSIYDNTVFKF